MRPPITYYGGKQRLAKELLTLIPMHRLYVEPFMGGGALFFAKEPSEAEIINDLNGNVTNFYRIAQTDFEELKKEVDGTLHSRAIYKNAKEIYKNPTKYTAIKRAWAFWVLTNQGFGGKIGSWALSKKSNKIGKTLANKREGFTKEYAERLKYTEIESKDALDIIKQYDSPEAFFYLDPPYFNSDCGHYKGYTEADYKRLLDALVHTKGKFLLSSYPSDILKEYVKRHGWKYREIKQKVRVTHLANKEKTEVLVWNYEISPAESSCIALPVAKLGKKQGIIKSTSEAVPSPLVQKSSDKSKRSRAGNVAVKDKNSGAGDLLVAKSSRNFEPELISLNPERKPLTIEALRTFEGFENISDEEAENTLYSIHTLCRIIYEYMTEQNNLENNNTLNIAA